MSALGFVLPLLPGKTDDDREAMTSCWTGHRKGAFEASRKRHGITREAVWIQTTPAGDAAVIYVEAENLEAMLKGLAESQEPFDRWFREYVRDVHGVALEDGFPPPEQVLDFRA
ncbi:hypothetical protein [Aeromicrobium sp.]|uniref:hypothetical protein n=1 Tax=Aeromicrobium sp. TaxID=1871063 RepID=UPI002FC6EEA7